jgi:hypothetical protein
MLISDPSYSQTRYFKPFLMGRENLALEVHSMALRLPVPSHPQSFDTLKARTYWTG